jgi:hypothetical protein
MTMLAAMLVATEPGAPTRAANGLHGEYFSDFTRPENTITFDGADLYLTRTDPVIDFWNAVDCYYQWQPSNWYGVRWTGSIRIPEAGEYAFGTVSDDGSQVWLDGELIIDNGEEQWWDWEDSLHEGSYTGLYPEGHGEPDDHLHGVRYLTAGYHAIEIRFFEARYYDGIELWWLKPGSGPSDIPYYGANCGSGISVNADTNWEIVPTEMLWDTVVAVPDYAGTRHGTLHPVVPNPFNPRTLIRYDLRHRAPVRLQIYDLRGRLVRNLVADETEEAGRHEVAWDGRDDAGQPLGAGTYLCRLVIPGSVASQRATLLK